MQFFLYPGAHLLQEPIHGLLIKYKVTKKGVYLHPPSPVLRSPSPHVKVFNKVVELTHCLWRRFRQRLRLIIRLDELSLSYNSSVYKYRRQNGLIKSIKTNYLLSSSFADEIRWIICL